MSKILKFILPVIFWIALLVVVLKVDYPETITAAGIFQLSSFLIPLTLALIFSINFFFNISFSILFTFGLIILLILKSLDSLNVVSAGLTLAAIYLMLSYFKKIRGSRRNRV